MRRLISSIIILTILVFNFSIVVNATEKSIKSEPKVTFSNEPTRDDLKYVDNEKLEEKAWIIDEKGMKSLVNAKELTGEIEPKFISGRVLYTFLRYDQNVTKENTYQHFVSSVSLLNTTTEAISLKYTQQNSKSNTWTTTGKVEVEAEFKVAVLAKAKATFGASITDSHTTSSSATVEFTMTVPKGKTGKISKYYAGKYSGGQGVWTGYDVIGGYPVGNYYELGSAWTVEPAESNYVATTY